MATKKVRIPRKAKKRIISECGRSEFFTQLNVEGEPMYQTSKREYIPGDAWNRHGSSRDITTDVPVTVLQVMVFGDGEFLAEIVRNEYLTDEV